jgi:hypothetical protein
LKGRGRKLEALSLVTSCSAFRHPLPIQADALAGLARNLTGAYSSFGLWRGRRGGSLVAQRFVPIELRKQHNNVAGFIYAVVGIAYAVLLGLVVVAAWEQYQTAWDTTEREANELAELFWLGLRRTR